MEWFKCEITEEMICRVQVLDEAFEQSIRQLKGLKLDYAAIQALLETFGGLLNGDFLIEDASFERTRASIIESCRLQDNGHGVADIG